MKTYDYDVRCFLLDTKIDRLAMERVSQCHSDATIDSLKAQIGNAEHNFTLYYILCCCLLKLGEYKEALRVSADAKRKCTITSQYDVLLADVASCAYLKLAFACAEGQCQQAKKYYSRVIANCIMANKYFAGSRHARFVAGADIVELDPAVVVVRRQTHALIGLKDAVQARRSCESELTILRECWELRNQVYQRWSAQGITKRQEECTQLLSEIGSKSLTRSQRRQQTKHASHRPPRGKGAARRSRRRGRGKRRLRELRSNYRALIAQVDESPVTSNPARIPPGIHSMGLFAEKVVAEASDYVLLPESAGSFLQTQISQQLAKYRDRTAGAKIEYEEPSDGGITFRIHYHLERYNSSICQAVQDVFRDIVEVSISAAASSSKYTNHNIVEFSLTADQVQVAMEKLKQPQDESSQAQVATLLAGEQ